MHFFKQMDQFHNAMKWSFYYIQLTTCMYLREHIFLLNIILDSYASFYNVVTTNTIAYFVQCTCVVYKKHTVHQCSLFDNIHVCH